MEKSQQLQQQIKRRLLEKDFFYYYFKGLRKKSQDKFLFNYVLKGKFQKVVYFHYFHELFLPNDSIKALSEMSKRNIRNVEG